MSRGRPKHVRVELPPIPEVWKESSGRYNWLGVRQYQVTTVELIRREHRMAEAMRDVRSVVSLEEVFGPGLLERWLRDSTTTTQASGSLETSIKSPYKSTT